MTLQPNPNGRLRSSGFVRQIDVDGNRTEGECFGVANIGPIPGVLTRQGWRAGGVPLYAEEREIDTDATRWELHRLGCEPAIES